MCSPDDFLVTGPLRGESPSDCMDSLHKLTVMRYFGIFFCCYREQSVETMFIKQSVHEHAQSNIMQDRVHLIIILSLTKIGSHDQNGSFTSKVIWFTVSHSMYLLRSRLLQMQSWANFFFSVGKPYCRLIPNETIKGQWMFSICCSRTVCNMKVTTKVYNISKPPYITGSFIKNINVTIINFNQLNFIRIGYCRMDIQ